MPAFADAPPHAPERGWSHRLLGRFHVTGVFWYRFHLWGVRVLPRWAVGIFVTLFTVFFFLMLRRIRRAIAANLEVVLGRCGFWRRQGRILGNMWLFAWCLTERYENLGTTRRAGVSTDDGARWEALRESGHGFLLVTAHLGNYEVGSMLPAGIENRQVIVVREPEVDVEAQRFIQELLERGAASGYSSHFELDNDPLHALSLLEALRKGAIVGVQGDRPHAGGRTVAVPFFGHSFAMPTGPATLARLAGAPLIPVFVVRQGRLRYRTEIGEPILVPRGTDRAADVAAATTRLAAAVEAAIRRHPLQWFCFRSVFPPCAQEGRRPPSAPITREG